jgi:hypothetical protein
MAVDSAESARAPLWPDVRASRGTGVCCGLVGVLDGPTGIRSGAGSGRISVTAGRSERVRATG